jgi:hypothetical protein
MNNYELLHNNELLHDWGQIRSCKLCMSMNSNYECEREREHAHEKRRHEPNEHE